MDFSDKTSYSINTKAVTMIVLGILVLVNILSLRYFVRFDLTEGKQYSISDSTRSILAELDDIVTVKAYFTENLPPQFLPIDRYVRDILAEYEAYGSGNFSYEFVDPEKKVEATQEAQRIGVRQVSMQIRENDSFSVKNGYLGIGIFYEGKSEALPVIQESDLSNIEYDLTSLIVKLTQPREMVVGFLQGHGEHKMSGNPLGIQEEGADYSAVNQVLSRNYDVKSIDFSKGDTMEGVDILVIAGAKRNLTDRDIFEIDQYMLKGGKGIFLVDSVQQMEGGIVISPLETNLKTLLAPLGITVDSNVLLDALSEITRFQEGPGQFFLLQYPPFIRLVSDNFTSFPVVAKIQSFVVRFISSITVIENENLKYDKFANTSPSSWLQEGSFDLNPTSISQPAADQLSSRVVGVNVSGMLPRLSDKDAVPSLQEWLENPDSGEFELKLAQKDENNRNREILKEATAEANIIVFADSDFIADGSIGDDQTSLVVFQNMVDYIVFGDELINIRSKALGSAAISNLKDSTKALMKFLGVALMPILVTAYGVFRLYIRRKEERMLRL